MIYNVQLLIAFAITVKPRLTGCLDLTGLNSIPQKKALGANQCKMYPNLPCFSMYHDLPGLIPSPKRPGKSGFTEPIFKWNSHQIIENNLPRSVCVMRPWDTAVVDILWARHTEIAADLRPSFTTLLDIIALPILKAVDPPRRNDPDIILEQLLVV